MTGEKCDRAFGTAVKLRAHEDRVHGGTRFWCTLCAPATPDAQDDLEGLAARTAEAVGFATYALLQAHMRAVHPPTCERCGKTFTSNRGLRQHHEIHHEGLGVDERRTFPCEAEGCGQAFTKKGNLVVHVKTVHGGERRFVCGGEEMRTVCALLGWDAGDACGAAFSTKANMEEHVRTRHLGLESAATTRRRKRASGAGSEQWGGSGSKRRRDGERHSTLADLTGVGHAAGHARRIACIVATCSDVFSAEHELEVHLGSAHGLAKVEAEYAMVERGALEGGRFWLGGRDDDVQAELEEEERLERLLDAQQGIPVGRKKVEIGSGLPWLESLQDDDLLDPDEEEPPLPTRVATTEDASWAW